MAGSTFRKDDNLYGYSGSSPNRYTDAFGLCEKGDCEYRKAKGGAITGGGIKYEGGGGGDRGDFSWDQALDKLKEKGKEKALEWLTETGGDLLKGLLKEIGHNTDSVGEADVVETIFVKLKRKYDYEIRYCECTGSLWWKSWDWSEWESKNKTLYGDWDRGKDAVATLNFRGGEASAETARQLQRALNSSLQNAIKNQTPAYFDKKFEEWVKPCKKGD